MFSAYFSPFWRNAGWRRRCRCCFGAPARRAKVVDGTFTRRLQSLRVGRCSPSAVEDPVGTRPLTTRKRDAGRENCEGRRTNSKCRRAGGWLCGWSARELRGTAAVAHRDLGCGARARAGWAGVAGPQRGVPGTGPAPPPPPPCRGGCRPPDQVAALIPPFQSPPPPPQKRAQQR